MRDATNKLIGMVLNGAPGSTLCAPGGLRTVTVNLDSPKIRWDELEGQQVMVVPMVMLTEGVHNGSAGPLYYPTDELAKTPAVWNHKPIVVYHPEINGQGVSACDPQIVNSRKIGVIFNAHYEGGRLKAEAWLYPDRVKAVDSRIMEALEAGTMVELSTGLFTDNEPDTGTWNGEDYVAVARNYRPDHLAILPDQTGACSIDDGAGLLRVNQASHETIRAMLYTALIDRFGDGTDDGMGLWIEAVFDDFVIYSRDGKLFKVDYTATETEVSLAEGEPVEVVRVIEFRTKAGGDFVGNHSNAKENDMQKAKFVAALIANTNSWTPEDKPFLMTLSEDKLRKVAPDLDDEGNAKAEPEDDEGATATATAVADPGPASANPGDPSDAPGAPNEQLSSGAQPQATPTDNVQEYLAKAPPQLASFLKSGLQYAERQKQALIGRITANQRCRLTEAQLGAKDLDELEAIADMVAPVGNSEQQAPAQNAQPSFAMMADMLPGGGSASQGTVSNEAPEEEPYVMPTINFGQDAS